MKISFSLITILMIYCLGYAQVLKRETLGVNGYSGFVYANTTSYFLQESIGQGSVINTFNVNNYQLRQGFLQPINGTFLQSNKDSKLMARVYPNPFDNRVEIKFEEVISDVLYVTVFDTLGRLVYEQTFSPNDTITLYINNIVDGHYFMRVQMQSEVLSAKLLKQ